MSGENTTIRVNDYMKEKKTHGNLEYPIAVYHVDLHTLYMGFVRWHWHEELEINIVIEGRMECLIGDDSFIMEAGDFIFINQNVMHSIHPVGNEVGRFYSIVFSPAILFSYSNTYLNTKYLAPIIGNAALRRLMINKDFSSYDSIMECFQELIRVNTQQSVGYELITKSCLCRFWVIMIEQFGQTDKNVPDKTTLSHSETRAKDAIIYIQAHFTEAVTLDEIAAAIHVSKSECCRCFKKVLRTTPFGYLMKYRIYMAALKISQDTAHALSYSDIAASVGFNNISYFNKLFKYYTGCTPSVYRKKLMAGGIDRFPDIAPRLFDEHSILQD